MRRRVSSCPLGFTDLCIKIGFAHFRRGTFYNYGLPKNKLTQPCDELQLLNMIFIFYDWDQPDLLLAYHLLRCIFLKTGSSDTEKINK